MAESLAEIRPESDVRDLDVRNLADGACLLAATANVIMQLARPEVGYGVVESDVEAAQVMRHPLRRWLTTVGYLAVALMGGPAEREACRRMVGRAHARVRSAPDSPVTYSAFDPELQLWVAACLYRGMSDMHAMLHGPADDETADAIYRAASRFGTTLQVSEDMWPRDRQAFASYWDSALGKLRIDPPVRAYLRQLITLSYLPRPFSAAFGPLNEFLTAGFLPPRFRDLMQLPWTQHEQRVFESMMRLIAITNRLLPPPARRFPFNACLLGLRARSACDRRLPCRPPSPR